MALLLPSHSLRAVVWAIPGRDGKAGSPIEPGKLGLRPRQGERVTLGIERDDTDRRPVAGVSAPVPWMMVPRPSIDQVAGGEHKAILPGMTLRRSDVTDAAVAAEVEIGIAPGVELGRATQGLTGADGASALSGVVDAHDGSGVAAMEFAQEGEQSSDLAAGILIDAIQADEWMTTRGNNACWLSCC